MEERIIDISYRHKLSHIGSCLTTAPILEYIYTTKKTGDIVVLSSGHAGLALYTALEKYEKKNAEELLHMHGIHPCKDDVNGITVSTGSLGQGITVAAGYALGDSSRNVHCIISDGECAEGSVWETLAFARRKNLTNLKIHVNINGYSAYDAVDVLYLICRLKAFWWRVNIWLTKTPCFNGLEAHYKSLKEEELKIINAQRIRTTFIWFHEDQFANIFDYCRSWIRNFGRNSTRFSRKVCERWFK
jgi:transketolase